MKLFNSSTALVVRSLAAQVAGTVAGGAIFQLGIRTGNVLWETGAAAVSAVTGSDRK